MGLTVIFISFSILFQINFKLKKILGIGNALPDALTTIALSKKGYAYMGISGSYAG